MILCFDCLAEGQEIDGAIVIGICDKCFCTGPACETPEKEDVEEDV